jgi:hypothetical protein
MVYLYVNSKNRTARKRLPDRAARTGGYHDRLARVE